jgi:dimethylsulfone monooxygenase
MGNSQSIDVEVSDVVAELAIAGMVAVPLVGTPEQVVTGLGDLADAGLDGVTLTWVDYESGLEQFREQILPLAEQAGLRKSLVASRPSR